MVELRWQMDFARSDAIYFKTWNLYILGVADYEFLTEICNFEVELHPVECLSICCSSVLWNSFGKDLMKIHIFHGIFPLSIYFVKSFGSIHWQQTCCFIKYHVFTVKTAIIIKFTQRIFSKLELHHILTST